MKLVKILLEEKDHKEHFKKKEVLGMTWAEYLMRDY